jgi:predicted ribosome quality control (RQC) complex YloA/Tae2 family protein
MSLTAREIAAVVAELAPLAGAHVEAVRVHAERALTLSLRGRAGEALLLLSAEPDVTRLHAAARRPRQPDAPFPFQAPLRRELEGARLTALETLPGDRVVALTFERRGQPLRLIAELTGRHGNLFLVGGDGIIRASAGRNLSQRRALVPGSPYVPPVLPPGPPLPASPPADGGGRGGDNTLRGQGDLARGDAGGGDSARGGGGQADIARSDAGGEDTARGGQDRLRFAPLEGARWPLSAAIERAYEEREEARLLAEGRRRLREPLRAAVARAGRALAKLADEAARVPVAEADRRVADLLKSSLHRVPRGAREVTVTEWTEDGPREVRVTIDPALTPQANMERYYRRYRRIAESAARVDARAAEVRAREAALRALLAAVDAAALPELPRLEKEARRLSAGPRPAAPPRRRQDEPAPPYRAFRSLAGVAILVGRGAAQNDALTLRVARGNDLWLHARGRTGAHVVARLERGRAPDQETLLDAAHLAIHFSDARGEPQADVAITRAKHVRKPKGAAPGAVTYSQEKVMLLRVERGRIERLLSEEEGAAAE